MGTSFSVTRALTILSILLSLPACQDPPQAPREVRLEIQRPLMGTLFRIVTYASDLPKAREAMDHALAQAYALEKIATDYDPDSELNRLCRAPHGQAVSLSPLLFDLLHEALRIAHLTEGAYDPTLGPLTHLWRETRRLGKLPDSETLRFAKSRCGYRHLILHPETTSATLLLSNMQLDLGGIAKGSAADMIFDHLAAAGFPRTLVAAGGDLRLGDSPPEQKGWTVALKHRHGENTEPLFLKNCAVSTSGDLHQKVTIENRSYSHLIDPQTGLGLTRARTATVIAPTATQTDPLATAACLMENPVPFFKNLPQTELKAWSAEEEPLP